MTVQWDPDIIGIPDVTCRGCGKSITQRAGYWEDTGGIVVCVKARPEDTGYVYHQPMPAGLRGGPGEA